MKYFSLGINSLGIVISLGILIYIMMRKNFKDAIGFLLIIAIPSAVIILGSVLHITSFKYVFIVKIMLVLSTLYLCIGHFLLRGRFNLFSAITVGLLLTVMGYGCYTNDFFQELVKYKEHYMLALYPNFRNPFLYLLILTIMNISVTNKRRTGGRSYFRLLNYFYFFIATVALLFSFFHHYLSSILGIAVLIGALLYQRMFKTEKRERDVLSSSAIITTENFILLGIYLITLAIFVKLFIKFGFNYRTFLSFLSALFMFFFFLMLLFSSVIKNRFRKYIERNLLTTKLDFRQEVIAIMEEIGAISDYNQAFLRVAFLLKDKFNIEESYLYLRLGKNVQCYYLKANRVEKYKLDIGQDMLDWTWRKAEIITRKDLPYELPIIDFNYLVPIIIGKKLIGILFLKELDHELKQDEKDLLYIMCEQIGLALLNLTLRKEIAESEKLSAFNRTSSFVVHDLKNMVTSLSLLIRNAEKHIDKPEFRAGLLKSLSHAVEQMQALIRKLKMLQKDEVTQKININDLVLEVCEELKPRLNNRVNLECNLAKTKPLIFWGRKEELKQIIYNLACNAIEAIDGKGQVTIKTYSDNGFSFIEVEDNGSGIPAEELDKIFEPFYSKKKSGLGIGLYQVKKTVENYHGEISVNSKVGEGTKFKIKFPEVELCIAGKF